MGTREGIFVLGDVASTLLTEYGSGSDPHTTAFQHRAKDQCVPGGAAFTASVIRRLIEDTAVPVHGAYNMSSLISAPTRRTQLIELHHFKSGSARVLRASRSSYLDLAGAPEATLPGLDVDETTNRIATVVVDLAGPFRFPSLITDDVQQKVLHSHLAVVRNHLACCTHPASNTVPTLFVSTPHSLPLPGKPASGSLWDILLADTSLARTTALVTSISVLRRHGLRISRRLSWEHSVEDLLQDLSENPAFSHLKHIGHILVRFGIASTVHINRCVGTAPLATLHFDPTAAQGIYREPDVDGDIIAKNSILIGCCLGHYPNAGADLVIDESLREGLVLSQLLFDRGLSFSNPPTPDSRLPIDLVFPAISEKMKHLRAGGASKRIGTTSIAKADRTSGSWSILDTAIDSAKARLSRVNLAEAIVRFGHEHVLNTPIHDAAVRQVLERPTYKGWEEEDLNGTTTSKSRGRAESSVASPIFTPVMTFENLVTLDRADMESLRTIRNLFAAYIAHPFKRPLSIAVFGTPGSGKSFAVKQLLKSIDPDSHRTEVVEYNVAQFQSVRDLESAVSRIRDINISRKIPLVFFDEFDCRYDGTELGWLRMFLALMQDGKFRGVSETVSVGESIFVFAGGTASSFTEFASRSGPSSQHGANRKQEQMAKASKLPDFISRLRGHLDIISLDAASNQPTPVVRRAMILRSILLSRFSVQGHLGREILIDPDVLYALLLSRTFKHGVRSMEAVVDMSTPIHGAMLKASLPPSTQLAMHIDSLRFAKLMERSAERPLTL